jgi:tripartite-type tricarboxylate transporter receptor subunit TctC
MFGRHRGVSIVLVNIAFALSVFAPPLSAQTYPVKPIRVIVGLAAGGAADVTARLLGEKLSGVVGQPIVVENLPGAGGAIATERVALANPDGYTLLMITSSAAALPALRAKLPFDMERDLKPVSLVASGPWLLLVNPSVPAGSVEELITLARKEPGKLNFGSSGVGGATHLAGEYLNMAANIKITHVPYKGGAESAAATAAGQVEITFSTIPSAKALIQGGRLKPLAVTTTTRSSLMPSVPTMSEAGVPGFDYTLWTGLLAPAAVPEEIIARLNGAITKVVETKELRAAFNKQGMDPRPSTPEEFAKVIHAEIARNVKLVTAIGLKPQ